jgi:hypothetical protein
LHFLGLLPAAAPSLLLLKLLLPLLLYLLLSLLLQGLTLF